MQIVSFWLLKWQPLFSEKGIHHQLAICLIAPSMVKAEDWLLRKQLLSCLQNRSIPNMVPVPSFKHDNVAVKLDKDEINNKSLSSINVIKR